jgi:hypothetical protein
MTGIVNSYGSNLHSGEGQNFNRGGELPVQVVSIRLTRTLFNQYPRRTGDFQADLFYIEIVNGRDKDLISCMTVVT